ncbi:hypothetical protein EGR_08713 [Echinococcus granulosus]|uniref:UPF0506 domain-containing protein n=1 Tax=Echinococcus granulosus TaxID=6210 RepID=W6U5M4_ECHGR|nr:hypothetical protein EGR_08713 [Echinococcus granulosus]EUB56448.1 hypothetical protein EGR_08713 [Echinococcus granulosus]
MQVTILVLVVFFLAFVNGDSHCRREGEDCSRTIFSRCCDPLYCQLQSFAKGKCVKCLEGRQFCMSDRECCSGKCHWYRICSDL